MGKCVTGVGTVVQKTVGKKSKALKSSGYRMQEWIKQVKEWGKMADRNLGSAIKTLKNPLNNKNKRKAKGK